MPEWTAEVTVGEGLARRLIEDQFPQLARASLRLLGEGWDNTVWLVDGRWVFRFPRRGVAVAGLVREIEALPRLAPRLPLPIPEPAFRGRPSDAFPWPFFGAPYLPGREPLGLDEGARAGLARPLAGFLRALHAAAVDGLPADPMRRADMAFRVPMAVEQLVALEQEGLWRVPKSVDRVLDAAADLPLPEPVAVVHGDLHLRHLLVDERGALSGVIDWGDVCRGDPSVDLPLLWSLLPPHGRDEFLGTYGPLSEEQLLRARVLAIFLCAVLARYGRAQGLPELEAEALAGLRRAAS